MSIARTVIDCLQRQRIPYEVIAHSHSGSSRETARAARLAPDRIAKAVMLGDRHGVFMAVIPASCQLDVAALARITGRRLELVSEQRLAPLFRDCDTGAVPPLGPAYGVETIVDERLMEQPQVYFEAGDHEELIRVPGEQFGRLLKEARHWNFRH